MSKSYKSNLNSRTRESYRTHTASTYHDEVELVAGGHDDARSQVKYYVCRMTSSQSVSRWNQESGCDAEER